MCVMKKKNTHLVLSEWNFLLVGSFTPFIARFMSALILLHRWEVIAKKIMFTSRVRLTGTAKKTSPPMECAGKNAKKRRVYFESELNFHSILRAGFLKIKLSRYTL